MLAYDGTVNGRYEISDPVLSEGFTVEPGVIYYLGHFDGQALNPLAGYPFGVIGFALAEDKRNKSYPEIQPGFDVVGAELDVVKEEIARKCPAFSGLSVVQVYDLSEPRRENRADK